TLSTDSITSRRNGTAEFFLVTACSIVELLAAVSETLRAAGHPKETPDGLHGLGIGEVATSLIYRNVPTPVRRSGRPSTASASAGSSQTALATNTEPSSIM